MRRHLRTDMHCRWGGGGGGGGERGGRERERGRVAGCGA